MKKSLRTFFFVTAVSVSSFCALNTYKSYDNANESLLKENIEAMSQSTGDNTGCPDEKKKKCWMESTSGEITVNYICQDKKNGQPCPSKKERIKLYDDKIGWCCDDK